MTEGHCSFCGKPAGEVFRLIAADGCKICNECIARCAEMIAGEYRDLAREVRFPSDGAA